MAKQLRVSNLTLYIDSEKRLESAAHPPFSEDYVYGFVAGYHQALGGDQAYQVDVTFHEGEAEISFYRQPWNR